MKIERFLLSRWFYYLLIAVVFLILIVVVFPSLIQGQVISRDFGHNLISEFWGILATLVLLIMIFEMREELLKKSLKERIFERIGTELHDDFEVLKDFVKVSQKEPLDQLEELSQKEKVELSQHAYRYFPKPENPIDAFFLDRLLKSRERIGDLESKYFELMEPQLRISLMEIQRNLDRLNSAIDTIDRLGGESLEDWFFELMLKSVHTIIREIYKIHKMGIEIYPSSLK